MKRKVQFQDSNKTNEYHNKKPRLSTTSKQKLSDLEEYIAKEFIPKYLSKGDVGNVLNQLQIMFGTPKAMEKLLTNTDYHVLRWAIENQNDKLLEYIVEHDTGRDKFLAMSQNDWSLLKQFIDVFKNHHPDFSENDVLSHISEKLTKYYNDNYKEIINNNALEYVHSMGQSNNFEVNPPASDNSSDASSNDELTEIQCIGDAQTQ